jgi:hypothetical protein
MRRSVFAVAAVLFLSGLVGGTLLDERPANPPVERLGYQVLEGDFHVHTRFSDGFLSPIDVVVQAQRRGLDVIAITEHNGLLAANLGRWFSELIGGPTVLIGQEITTHPHHLIALGLAHGVSWDQSLESAIGAIHAQGGLAIAAHPVGRFWPAVLPVRHLLDGAEVMHPLAYGGRGGAGWSWDEMRQFFQEAGANGNPLTAIGSSDYHFFSPLGICRTLVFAESARAEDIMTALREGRTVVYDLAGRAYGDPALVAALERDAFPFASQDYNYHGANVADRVLRTVGWVGALGLLLFRPRLGRRPPAA